MPALTWLDLSEVGAIELGIRVERTGITALQWNGASGLEIVAITENPALELIAFFNVPRLASLEVTNNPKLVAVVFESVTAAVDVDVSGGPAGGSRLQLNALTTAGQIALGKPLALVNLESLQTVTRGIALTTDAITLSLPELVSAEHFEVYDNPRVNSLTAPKLREVTNRFRVTTNPRLPACHAQAILAKLTTPPALVDTSGNDGSGTCN
jgi:hypothetical protein